MTQFQIKIMMQSKEVVQDQAHSGAITAFEFATIEGQEILFSASQDGFLRAWAITGAKSSQIQAINKVDERNLQQPISSLQMATESFLIIGLSNGSF